MSAPRLLVVEDDDELRGLLVRGLREEEFVVAAAPDAAMALRHVDGDAALDALVIDIGLPDADGRDLCQAIRVRGCDAPVLFLTAKDAVSDRLSGFSAGGDDYVVKPFHFAELVARLHALLKRTPAAEPARVAGLRLDPRAHAVTGGQGEAALTPTEFRLLAAMAADPGGVVRRTALVAAAWPDGATVHENTLDQYIARLRRKLREVSAEARIATVHGVGYRLG